MSFFSVMAALLWLLGAVPAASFGQSNQNALRNATLPLSASQSLQQSTSRRSLDGLSNQPTDQSPSTQSPSAYPAGMQPLSRLNSAELPQTPPFEENRAAPNVDPAVVPATHWEPHRVDNISADPIPGGRFDSLTNEMVSNPSSESRSLAEGGLLVENGPSSGKRRSASVVPERTKPNSMQDLIKTLAVNTGIVLVLGIGFVVVGKGWMRGKNRKSPGRNVESCFDISSTLKVGPKSYLHLVKVDEQQVLVACDATGIKSVVALNSNQSFSGMLGEVEDKDEPEVSDTPEQRAKHLKDYLASYMKNV